MDLLHDEKGGDELNEEMTKKWKKKMKTLTKGLAGSLTDTVAIGNSRERIKVRMLRGRLKDENQGR